MKCHLVVFFFSSRRRHTRYIGDWSSDVCSSDLWNCVREKTEKRLLGPMKFAADASSKEQSMNRVRLVVVLRKMHCSKLTALKMLSRHSAFWKLHRTNLQSWRFARTKSE